MDSNNETLYKQCREDPAIWIETCLGIKLNPVQKEYLKKIKNGEIKPFQHKRSDYADSYFQRLLYAYMMEKTNPNCHIGDKVFCLKKGEFKKFVEFVDRKFNYGN